MIIEIARKRVRKQNKEERRTEECGATTSQALNRMTAAEDDAGETRC
jgi:CelD/BcsL family acetyltransferase involved in cellulose biosynthesis